MPEKKHKCISPHADRMGRYLGQLRVQKRITLKRLSRGLCGYLNKIENGERQAGKLLMDTFFQRLGKPVDLFGRILSHKEFMKWTQRQEIISHLRCGDTEKVRECAELYRTQGNSVLDRQFLAIAEINCRWLEGAPARELLPPVTAALRLTQPDFDKVPSDTLLLSQNETRLLLACDQILTAAKQKDPPANDRTLLIPCEEQGYVYCINHVIRSRRALLGFSQEELSAEACGLRSVSRVENEERKLQRKNRKRLLQKVNLSGERYDCEIISERYEDCLMSRELTQAINAGNLDEARHLLGMLRDRVPDLPTNQQYFLRTETAIRSLYPENHPDRISVSEQKKLLKNALRLTLPLDLDKIGSWPASILSINEILTLMMIAVCDHQEKQEENSLAIVTYIKNCLEITGTDPAYYEDICTRLSEQFPEQ